MRIDAHQHYWKLDRGDYGWLTPDTGILYRDYLPNDLLPHLREHRVDGTILVQAAATHEETDYMLSLSDSTDTILGVVGWLDLHDPAYREHYERFSRHSKFVGFRVMIQDMPDAREVLEPDVVEALTYFAQKDVPVDLLVVSHQLDVVVELLERVPGLRGVIDHIAKPRIADGILEPWHSQMKAIAKHPKIYCKLSGMVTEADHTTWKPQDFAAYIRPVLEMFGPGRILFGSDWPVCLLAADYGQVVDVLEQALPESYTEQERAQLFGLNAKQFYKL
ncbi:amidohydrolase family protein [Paenibacillus mendelii]|uniref:Amidohydrolase family protein n=1 Tax=Paenibacillus mendelii TaxID=206163 RepID=A0ABV6J9D4_9BACL|nr:amidohydrolase family protein [Paenibacillus mendelii]MCQ6559833.1 amidohydrolase family protein [Paenibacillus mendelii]